MSGLQRTKLEQALGLDPPHMPANIECEQALLGAFLMDPSLYAKVSDFLVPEMFWEAVHRALFEFMVAWIPQGKPVNALTVKTALGDRDLGGVTISEYMARLRAEGARPQEVVGYARILRDLYVRRVVIGLAETARQRAYNAPLEDTGKALVDSLIEQLGALRTDNGERAGFEHFDSVSLRAVQNAEQSLKADGRLIGHSTGLPRLDDALGGLRKTDLIILAARPGIGKTALAGQIGFNVAIDLSYRRSLGEKTGVVGVFSLEMSNEQFVERLICAQAGVAAWKIRKSKLTQDDVVALNDARRQLGAIPFEIDATSGLTIKQLALRAKALHKKYGLELLIVDYLQLLAGSTGHENRNRELTEITVGLKGLAKELDVPVIALSQLSRQVESRDDKRPMLSDLRESGSIEQDADIVMFIYRDEVYLGRPPEVGTTARETWDRRKADVEGKAEIIIGKHRHGPTGLLELGFDGSGTRFLNEPPPRDDTLEPIRQRRKGVKFHAQSIPCLERLKTLVMSEPVWVADAPGTPRWAERVASYERWKSICCGELLDIAATEPERRGFMKSVIQPLTEAKLIERGPEPGYEWVWLTEMGKTWTEGTN